MRHVNSFFPGFVAGCLLTICLLSMAGYLDGRKIVESHPAGPVATQTAPADGRSAALAVSGSGSEQSPASQPQEPPATEQQLPAGSGVAENQETQLVQGREAPDAEGAPAANQIPAPLQAMDTALASRPADFGQPRLLTPVTRHYPHSPDFANPVLEANNSAFPFASMPSFFSLRKMGPGNGPTILVVGGIQGDEPGGFSAAALLSTQYTITSGQVWVVPDLNFASILQRDRGLFGDMNRKFAALRKDDPEYTLISELKGILLDEQVDLILNLHDGSGFYRPTFENSMRNPSRWGQSVIIDQTEMEAPRFNQLLVMAQKAEDDANALLVDPDHRYYIRNTNTRDGDREMEKSLSYFAVINGKPAFGIEASKEFTTEFRSYYHMLIIESFMKQMGIGFERNFPLSPKGVLVALNSNLALSLFDGKVVLPLDNVRPVLNVIPFPRGEKPRAVASRPLLALLDDGATWRIAYGNRTLTRIKPDVRPFDDTFPAMEIEVDRGQTISVAPGTIFEAKNSFFVRPMPGYRLNAIGAVKDHNGTEAEVEIAHADFMPRFSVDRAGTIFRLEVYKEDAFCGMVLVQFGQTGTVTASDKPLTAIEGRESSLGF